MNPSPAFFSYSRAYPTLSYQERMAIITRDVHHHFNNISFTIL